MIHPRKYRVHILIWVVMLIYVATAPALYAQFLIRNGKPSLLKQELPAVTAQTMASADRMDPVVLHGQNLYNLWGWAFIQGEIDPSVYDRYLVLRSDTNTYFFATEIIKRPDVQEHFADLQQDVIDSGFTTYIAKEAIVQGTYQIGVLFRPNSAVEADTRYVITNKEIVRTANQLKLVVP